MVKIGNFDKIMKKGSLDLWEFLYFKSNKQK